MRALSLLLAAAWVAVGVLSTSTHGLPTYAWVALATAAAGSALAVARYRTKFAMRAHMTFVIIAAFVSAVSLADVGRYRATAVWAVIVMQSFIVVRLQTRSERS